MVDCGDYFMPIVDAMSTFPNLTEQNNNTASNQRIDKLHWICDYTEDIFETLREDELKRHVISFRSQQSTYHRPILLRLLKYATEKHNLCRTTLHLATYLLDCFMDNFTIRADKLNLTVITCLIVAAKIEEADMNMPKFAELNKLVSEAYLLYELKSVERKVLSTFNFELLRPTTATFAEYFANGFLTSEDYQMYTSNWYVAFGVHQPGYVPYSYEQQTLLPLYSSYEEMVSALTAILFEFVDVSLNYIKFTNVRPSLIAAACIAAVRHLKNVPPLWTSQLIKLTQYTYLMVAPYVDALIALYRMHTPEASALPPINPCSPIQLHMAVNSLIDESPDSGLVSADTKSESSGDEDEAQPQPQSQTQGNKQHDDMRCYEYALPLPKRRRIF